MQKALHEVVEKLSSWGEEAIAMLPNFAVAILVLTTFWILSKGAKRLLRIPLRNVAHDKQLEGLVLTLTKMTIIGTGVVIALGVMRLQGTVTSLLAGVGVIGLALGFAFQDIAANFISGIILAVKKPFASGDMIEVGSFFGEVCGINLRTTIGKTFDGQFVHMPNKFILGESLKNYSQSGERRVNVVVGVSYGDDLEKAERVAIEALSEVSERVQEKEVVVFYDSFGDSSITFTGRFWIDTLQHNFLKAQHQAIKNIKRAFEEHSLTIPFPIRTLDFGIVGGKELSDALPANGQRQGLA